MYLQYGKLLQHWGGTEHFIKWSDSNFQVSFIQVQISLYTGLIKKYFATFLINICKLQDYFVQFHRFLLSLSKSHPLRVIFIPLFIYFCCKTMIISVLVSVTCIVLVSWQYQSVQIKKNLTYWLFSKQLICQRNLFSANSWFVREIYFQQTADLSEKSIFLPAFSFLLMLCKE